MGAGAGQGEGGAGQGVLLTDAALDDLVRDEVDVDVVGSTEREVRPEAELADFVAELDRRATEQHAPVAEGVTLATLHAAKGLEWDVVFVAGMHEGTMPIIYAEGPAAVEEERVPDRRTFVLVDGENLDATLGNSVLGRRPLPEERPRWERVTAFVEREWQQAHPGDAVDRRHIGVDVLPADAWAHAVAGSYVAAADRNPGQSAAVALAAERCGAVQR